MGIRWLVFRVSDGEDIGEKIGVVFLGCAAGKNRIGDDDVDERGEGLDAHFEKLRPQPQRAKSEPKRQKGGAFWGALGAFGGFFACLRRAGGPMQRA